MLKQDLSVKQIEHLTSELASFARAGIPMPEGLRQLHRSLLPGRLKRLSAHLAGELERGASLSDALGTAPVATPPEFAALVRCAEKSGEMTTLLDFAVDHSRRIQRHRASLLTTLIYPAFVLLALFLCISFMLAFIVPKFKDIYDQLGAELPMPTQMLVEFGNIMAFQSHWILIPLFGVIVGCIISSDFRGRMLRLLSRLPGFRSLAALSDTALVMKFVGRMTGRGIPMPDALRAAGMAVWQSQTRRALREMSAAAEEGRPIAPYISGEAPATAGWLFQQAEERGNLPAACEGIAEYCEERFDRLSARALALIEPGLVLLVAFAVGMTVIALYLPLFNIPKIVGKD